jgi:hypothetical protein
MARKISPPPAPLDDPNQALECELHLEPAFDELASRAQAEGWSEADVDTALLSLARHRILARIERERISRQVGKAQRQ